LLRDKCDVIHTHLPHPWSADVSAVVATIKKKPLFVTYHNDLAGKGWHRILTATYNLTALTMLLHAARKIFITSDQYIERSTFLLQFEDKIVTTPLGVNTDRYRPYESICSEGRNIFLLRILDRFHM